MPTTTVLVANPSPDVYGSDLQLLESVTAMTSRGWRVVVAIPHDGALVPMLVERGAEVQHRRFPVLRRAFASPRGILALAGTGARAVAQLRREILAVAPDVVYVNTVTLPWWIVAGRLAGVPTVCHVHEAEVRDRRAVRTALTLPLAAASLVITNGRAALEAMTEIVPCLRRRARVVDNGVAPPPSPPSPPPPGPPVRLAVIGRLSPRKAPDVALEATALLRARGVDATLEICGTAFEGYEWFVDDLQRRASAPDLRGHVTFAGYVDPIWTALERAHIVVAPSLGESFGNVVVQAQLALRPVIATGVQGHLDTVRDGETGLLVPTSQPVALADAIVRLVDDPALAGDLAERARREALERFSLERYGARITTVMEEASRR